VNWSGTSAATPILAGCLALSIAARPDLWQVSGSALDPKYGVMLPAQVVRARELLRDLSDLAPLVDGRDRAGYGRVDASLLAEELSVVTLVLIDILGSTQSLRVGETRQLAAIGSFSDGSTGDISNQVLWASSDPTVLRVTPEGRVEALREGQVSVACTLAGILSPAVGITVTAPAGVFSATTAGWGLVLAGAATMGMVLRPSG